MLEQIALIDRQLHRQVEAETLQRADFEYLKSQVAAGLTPKVTIPSPTMLHFRGGRAGISKEHYPELEPAFYDDVAKAYGDELRSLSAAGCNYVQMDDTNLAYLCDEKMREAARQRGDDPNELPHRYAKFINKVVAQKPAGMTLAMHLCRGNFKSTHAAAGNYEPVAEALLSEMNLDAYFMEYDDDRSGDFRPLRFLPKGKIAILAVQPILITLLLAALAEGTTTIHDLLASDDTLVMLGALHFLLMALVSNRWTVKPLLAVRLAWCKPAILFASIFPIAALMLC